MNERLGRRGGVLRHDTRHRGARYGWRSLSWAPSQRTTHVWHGPWLDTFSLILGGSPPGFPSLTPPDMHPSIYNVVRTARGRVVLYTSFLTSSDPHHASLSHGGPATQANEHHPRFQGPPVCQPASATCQAAAPRSLKHRVRSWPKGSQEHLQWVAADQH